MPISLNSKYLSSFLADEELGSIEPQLKSAHQILVSRTGPGSEFLGWLDLPINYDREEFERIKSAAHRIRATSDILIVIGIGGSYLGASAAIEFLNSTFYNNKKKDAPDIYFAGNNISGGYLSEILELCDDKDISINVISKSGTTTEPALAFRVFRELLEKKYGADEARKRIYATTDKSRGTLRQLAGQEGYETFAIADDIGGRYSVLTAVGLLPIAASGANINALMAGAKIAHERFSVCDIELNDCYKYAALRNILHRKGKLVELYVSYEPNFRMMSEWLKQLYGESEGKNHKGLFPASVTFSTDLHSLGQFIQDGSRIMFETVINIEKPARGFRIKSDPANSDGLNFLAGQDISIINKKAMEGTILAHTQGGTPNIVINLSDTSEVTLGELIYFFERACAVSGYILGVNPFDQPGVEAYKKNMFALLGKPGYESLKAELEASLRA